MVVYAAFVTMVALSRLDLKPDGTWVIAANLLTLLLIWLVHRPGLSSFGRTIRDIYPVLLLPALYGALDLLNGPDIGTWDTKIQQFEAAIFGRQISREWWQSSPSRFWSTLLHASYFAYYFIVPFPALFFLSRGQPQRARKAVELVVATFLFCYVAFLLVPVAGPYYEFSRPTGAFIDNWAARVVYATLDRGSSFGAAFPSSHVAATFASTIVTWQGSRKAGLILVVPTLLLTVAVVYCQMHYVVDALVGLLVPVPIAFAMRQRDGRPEGRKDGP